MSGVEELFCESITKFLTEAPSMEDELDELLASVSPEISLLQLATELGETPTFDLQLHPSRTNVEFKPAASGELQHFKDKNLNKNTTKSTATWENHFEAWRKWRNVNVSIVLICHSMLFCGIWD